MAEIKRKPKRPTAAGMTSAADIADPTLRLMIQELQERLGAISQTARASIPDNTDELRSEFRHDVGRLNTLNSRLLALLRDDGRRIGELSAAMRSLHAHTIYNTTGETIPAHSVVRIVSYDPDVKLHTVGKPQGPASDRAELLLFTGYFDIEAKAIGVAYRPSDVLVKVNYDAPDASFEPDAGTLYNTQSGSWRLLGTSAGSGVAIAIGAVAEEWDTSGGAVWVRQAQSSSGVHIYNASGVAIPEGGIVWLQDLHTDVTYHSATRPVYPGISMYGVAVSDIAVDGVGLAYIDGIHPVRVTDYSTLSAGWRIGITPSSFDGVQDDLGPMQCMGKLDTPMVKALITHDLGDRIIVDASAIDATVSGTYKHIRFSPSYAVRQSSAGVISVELA